METSAARGVIAVDEHKRELRKLKREIKRAGNKRRRQFLKRQLTDNEEEAPFAEFDFCRTSSAGFNGMDHDCKRRRDREDL